MCGRVAYLHVAFPCHIATVCEKFVNSERIFLYEPRGTVLRRGSEFTVTSQYVHISVTECDLLVV